MLKMVIDALPVIKDILKDVFEGLTDEELKKTDVRDIMKVVIEIVQYSMATLGKSVSPKN